MRLTPVTASPPPPIVPESPSTATPLRSFGRFELRALLSKSARSLVWRVFDARHGQELMLCMPMWPPSRVGSTPA